MAAAHSTTSYRFNGNSRRLELTNIPEELAQRLHDAGWDVYVLWDGSVGLLHPRSRTIREARALLAAQGFGLELLGVQE
jgi:hypothetical protein